MKARAAVLREFNKPLELTDVEVCPLEPGEILVKVLAAGVCGSDVHIWKGNDPRVPLPLIPGHENVGEVVETGGRVSDIYGDELKPGDTITWERSVTCGRCWQCTVAKEPGLCATRRVYGISYSAAERPFLVGGYAEMIHLRADMKPLKIADDADRRLVAAAGCAGATAAHAIELAQIQPGDSVVVAGPGPVGLFVTAFAAAAGAGELIVLGARGDAARLDLARELGATDTMEVDTSTPEERRERVMEATRGVGARRVFECAGRVAAAAEGLKLVGRGGKLLLVGIATPVGDWPVSVYEDISVKNVGVQGVWVSDTRHLAHALALVAKKPALGKIITKSFPLDDATEALETMAAREVTKAVIEP